MARKRQPAWELEQQKIQDRLRQLWYKLAPNTQSPGGANPNPNPGLGVGPNPLPSAGINPSGMSIPLTGASMEDRALELIRQWAMGGKNIKRTKRPGTAGG